MPAVIEVDALTKQFGDITAVHNLSFSVAEGEVHGFLGQNGAGKSTTIRMLLTLIWPTSGSIHIFGKALRQHRHYILSKTGAIVEKPDLYKYLTALENLKVFAAMSGINPTRSELLAHLSRVGLEDRANSKLKTYSQGMKQRLGIAVALLHNPDLIILDEPMNGLDPQGIADMRNLILHLSRNERKTILVSSHLLSEMQLIADSMLIIHKGEKIVEGKVADLLNPTDIEVEVEVTDIQQASPQIRNSAWSRSLVNVADGKIIFSMGKKEIPQFIRDISMLDIHITSVRPKHSLEDYFLSLTTSAHVEAAAN